MHLGKPQKERPAKVQCAIGSKNYQRHYDWIATSHRQEYRPAGSTRKQRSHPRLCQVRPRQSRGAQALVQRAAKQRELDPRSQACGNRKAGHAPSRSNSQQAWQR